MELVIQGRNLEVSESIRTYVARKMQRISRHLPAVLAALVELSFENTRSQDQRVVAQVTLNCNRTILRGEERAANVNAAVDAVADVLDRRVQRLKGSLYRSEQARQTGKGVSIRALETQQAETAAAAEEMESPGRVVRTKRLQMKPMTVEEAALQMELLGHDFFLFYDGLANRYCVLYRRRDGDLGLIESELE